MAAYHFTKLALEGACLVDCFFAGDNRGGFTKSFEKDIYAAAGIEFHVNETFASVSAKNVVRGIHFQTRNPQAKLVSVVKGKVWDVIVDLRLESPTYGKWSAVELSDENHRALYIPRGFGHGFASLEDGTVMLYQCDGAYDKESDTGILFNDSTIRIQWPLEEDTMIHSSRDLQLMSLQEYECLIREARE